MSRIIDISRDATTGSVTFTVNGLVKTIANDRNIISKILYGVSEGLSQQLGVICKTTDEKFRCRMFKEDTLTINSITAPTNLSDLVLLLNNSVFSGIGTSPSAGNFLIDNDGNILSDNDGNLILSQQ